MQEIQFDLDREFVELCNLLKLCGLADSGGQGKLWVGEGRVKVDGQVELRKTAKIRDGQLVEIGDSRILVKAI
ncbi:RNA-binding S4 domain-containing protein [Leeia sp. TBRC 13508]|uniref:RNA-binding S4 domain-containing protein n=1 Tax=Leeia speluncae TaxID=2884804 RepID=A0ABS8DBB3_9NEIS|nr:RNA-binding S4 domain-containing protein [Leeia speluncae]MCB6185216.1 RNA-binding S4 domain-containing protein [Leeia speluncae]